MLIIYSINLTILGWVAKAKLIPLYVFILCRIHNYDYDSAETCIQFDDTVSTRKFFLHLIYIYMSAYQSLSEWCTDTWLGDNTMGLQACLLCKWFDWSFTCGEVPPHPPFMPLSYQDVMNCLKSSYIAWSHYYPGIYWSAMKFISN